MFNPLEQAKKLLESRSPRQKLIAAILIFSLVLMGLFFTLSESDETSSGLLDSTPMFFLGAFVKLIGVLLLIFLTAAIFRHWNYLGSKGGSARQLRLLETVRLSPKQSLHLVSVGHQKILVGATDQGVTLISPVDEDFCIPLAETFQSEPDPVFNSPAELIKADLPMEYWRKK